MEPTRTPPLVLSGTDLSGAASARRFVRQQVRSVTAGDVTSDVVLATSELVTNAVQHGPSSTVTVTVHTDDNTVAVTVENDGSAPDVPTDVGDWTIAAPSAPNGRGLGIVRAISDRVEMTRTASSVSITVEFDRRR